ncbi:MAG: ATP-binding protein [Ignavibacteriae bacterium]|nr:ATP-binding protein [Ignavibacteriota bacterium]
MATTLRMTLKSSPKAIGRVEGFLQRVKMKVDLDEIHMHKLMVSVTEAVNNAIIQGNKSDPTKRVIVECDCEHDGLVLRVSDEGKGFRLKNIRNPLREENLLRTSGRGIFLMRTLMDSVDYQMTKTGATVTLVMGLRKQ